MPRSVLLRHGESMWWNRENGFTGWVDVPLSPKGMEEAADHDPLVAMLLFRGGAAGMIRITRPGWEVVAG